MNANRLADSNIGSHSAKSVIGSVTNTKGQVDTYQLAQWLVGANEKTPAVADKAYRVIEGELAKNGIADASQLNQNIRAVGTNGAGDQANNPIMANDWPESGLGSGSLNSVMGKGSYQNAPLQYPTYFRRGGVDQGLLKQMETLVNRTAPNAGTIELEVHSPQLSSIQVGDTLLGRKVTGVMHKSEGGQVVGGTIILEQDKAQELQPYKQKLEQYRQELSQLKEQRNNIEIQPRQQRDILVANAEVSLESKVASVPVNLKAKASTEGGFTATAGEKTTGLGIDSKGRVEVKQGDVTTKAPAFDDGAPLRVSAGPLATEDGKILVTTPIPPINTTFGDAQVKVEAGVNLLEFGHRVAEPVRVANERLVTFVQLQDQVTSLEHKIDALKNTIATYKAELPPVTIQFTTK
tara:strand:+ start:3030 stop:4250 length:1221 start_codon:yes stop_codon:yes gene_type:complete